MALTILTGSSQAAATNYSYSTSGSADWASVPTASYFYDIVDKIARYKTSDGIIVNSISSSYAVSASYAPAPFPYTGSAIISGSLTLTGSLNVSGSTTQIGNNSLLGNTTLSGSLTISGNTVMTGSITATNLTASFGYVSASFLDVTGKQTVRGYLQFYPTADIVPINQTGSYIYSSGSEGDMYFAQTNGSINNVIRLRWLEGNMYSGLLNGGVISTQSSTVFQVSSGSGLIVSLNGSLNSDPYPAVQYLNWPTLSSSIAPLSASFDQSFVSIEPSGSAATIFVQGLPYDDGQFNTLIPIGNVIHQNRSTINAVATYPSVAYGYKQRSSDFIRAFGPLKLSGLNTVVSGSTTGSLQITSGTSYNEGRNYVNDVNNPSYVIDTGQPISKIFRYYQSGSAWVYLTNGGAGFETIDPTQYSLNGILTPVPGTGANREYSIQRIYYFPGGATKGIYVYYGNTTYPSAVSAIANIPYEDFIEAPNTAAGAVLSAYLVVRNNADFTVPESFNIRPGGLFRNIGGSGGGGSAATQTLASLTDVNVLTSLPTDGQPLAYNATTLKWENRTYISASLQGNASTATTASYALTASSALEISSAITNNINNNILTATGTGTINGESSLTFDSQTLTIGAGILTFTGATNSRINQSSGGGANGLYSYAQGLRAIANGSYAHAEGADTSAPGESSHAEGSGSATSTQLLYGARANAIISGVFDLAGDVTTVFASGNRLYYNSAAYPDNTSFVVDTAVFGGVNTTITLTDTAITDSSFVVGSLDYSYFSWVGNQSSVSTAGHAEGWNTNAVADYSHAEGTQTQTFGRYSHAEGSGTQANGNYSHAEGQGTKAFGQNSHAEGGGTQANGTGAHAEGDNTQATGDYSHAEGNGAISTGNGAHAEGINTQAIADYSHAEGKGTQASGDGAHAEGVSTQAIADYSHAEGDSTVSYGNGSHTEGNSTQTGITTAYTADDITAGLVKINTSYGDQTGLFTQGSSLMYGSATSLDNYNLLISGSYWDTTNTYVQLLDLSVDTATAPTIVAVQSDINYNNISNNAGDQLFIGQNSHAEGASTQATGNSSHAEGIYSAAPGDYSHSEGNGAISTGDSSHAEGEGTQASGDGAHAEGVSTQAIADYSHAEGYSTISGILGYEPNTPITSGVFELGTPYGDISSQFVPGNFVLIQDKTGQIAGVATVYKLEIASVTYNATPATEITLVDSGINTTGTKYSVGQYETIAPVYAKTPIGDSSHAAGQQTQTYGYASNTAGFGTEALGYYQTVVGQGNIPLSSTSSFIVGNGSYDVDNDIWTRSNLLLASGDAVQITGSLQVSGSITGSLLGTASFAVMASYINGSINKNNVVANTSFTGTPLKATVTFATAFPNTDYSISITGEDSRMWTAESKTAAGFVINSTSGTALTGNTYWIAASYGEFNG